MGSTARAGLASFLGFVQRAGVARALAAARAAAGPGAAHGLHPRPEEPGAAGGAGRRLPVRPRQRLHAGPRSGGGRGVGPAPLAALQPTDPAPARLSPPTRARAAAGDGGPRRHALRGAARACAGARGSWSTSTRRPSAPTGAPTSARRGATSRRRAPAAIRRRPSLPATPAGAPTKCWRSGSIPATRMPPGASRTPWTRWSGCSGRWSGCPGWCCASTASTLPPTTWRSCSAGASISSGACTPTPPPPAGRGSTARRSPGTS